MDYGQISGPQFFNFFEDDDSDSGDSFFDNKVETPPSQSYNRITRSTVKKNPTLKQVEDVKKRTKSHQLPSSQRAASLKSASTQLSVVKKNITSMKTKKEKVSIKTRSPAIKSKTPAIKSKTPAIKSKTPAIKTKSPTIETKSPTIETKSPTIETKSPTIKTKQDIIVDSLVTAPCLLAVTSAQIEIVEPDVKAEITETPKREMATVRNIVEPPKETKSCKKNAPTVKPVKPFLRKAVVPTVSSKPQPNAKLPIKKTKCESHNVTAKNRPTASRAVAPVVMKQPRFTANKVTAPAAVIKRPAPFANPRPTKIVKKTTRATTPECLKRSLNKAASRVVKSSEDIEMERIAYLRKEMTMHLKSNQAAMKRVVQSAALKPISLATQIQLKASKNIKPLKGVPVKRLAPSKFPFKSGTSKTFADLESFADINKCRWTSTPFFPKAKLEESQQQNVTVFEYRENTREKKTATAAHSGLFFTRKQEVTTLDVEEESKVKVTETANKNKLAGRPLRNITGAVQSKKNITSKPVLRNEKGVPKKEIASKNVPRNTLSRTHRMRTRSTNENLIAAKN